MLKKVLKRGGIGLAVVVTAVAALGVYIQVDGVPRYPRPAPDTRITESTPARLERGAKLASMLCLDCHANSETHRLTGKHVAELPPEFGTVYSKNITRHPTKGIGNWTDGDLRVFLRTGLRADGTYAPPYMIKLPNMSDEDLDSIIAFLRSDDPRVAASEVEPPGVTKPSFLVKALTHGPFKPLPYPQKAIIAPSKKDAVTYGRYLTVNLECYGCHSANFTSMNVLEPEKTDGYLGGGNTFKLADGKEIRSANLTADPETGIGNWTEADFVRALRKGFRPDGRVLHYPMETKSELDDEEAAAIYAYLRTVPKIKNAVPRPTAPAPVAQNDRGKSLYTRYGCVSCHGETGKGAVGDLRRANAMYPSDAELRRWIDEAPTMKPGTKMPGWKGVIKEEDYPPLLAHVRALSAAKSERTTMNP
ncbi:MAG: putative diheme cytochrome c-553 [Labilithrix sp.]|nr:putative diheme cytochrome c-553 [Labilithrix sp.]